MFNYKKQIKKENYIQNTYEIKNMKLYQLNEVFVTQIICGTIKFTHRHLSFNFIIIIVT